MSHAVIMISEDRRDKLNRFGFAFARVRFAERVEQCLQHEVVLYQSRSTTYETGYFATAKLVDAGVYVGDLRLLYLQLSGIQYFRAVVPVFATGPVVEASVRTQRGTLNGRKFSDDVRLISVAEFNELSGAAFLSAEEFLSRGEGLQEPGSPRKREEQGRWARDAQFRSLVLPEYEAKCAITGQQLISGNGLSSGLIICHAKAVTDGGEDVICNAAPLCPDFHYRWDHGTIDILDDYTWVPLGADQDPIVRDWVGPRKLFIPTNPSHRLSAEFLAAHRSQVQLRHALRPTDFEYPT